MDLLATLPDARRSREWLRIVLALLALKAVLVGWAFYSFDFGSNPHESWFSIWHRWDSEGYERIALAGYSAEGLTRSRHEFLSFVPPGFPLFIAIVHACGVPPIWSALLIPFVTSLIASLLLYELMLFEFADRRAALRAVAYLNLFPSSYFFIAAYSEALCLTFMLSMFYLVRVKNRFALGCAAAFCAIVTRWFATTLLPSLFVQAFASIRSGAQPRRALYFLLMPVVAVELFFIINFVYYGSPFAYREHALRNTAISRLDSFPFTPLLQVIRRVVADPYGQLGDHRFVMLFGWSNLLLLLVALAFAALWRRLPVVYAVFGATYLCFIASINWAHGTHRYLLLMFPLFMALALIRNRLFFALTCICSAALLLHLCRYFVLGAYAY